MAKKIVMAHSFEKLNKKEIEQALKDGCVVFNNIKWETDGQRVKLPKAVRVPKADFESDFDFDMEGADFLSDKYGWLVNSFEIEK